MRAAFRPSKIKTVDKVRFGRALGYGARHAAKSLQAAAEAAAAPGRETQASRPATAVSTAASTAPERNVKASNRPVAGAVATPAQQILRGAAQVRAARQQAGKHVRRSFFGPLAKFSSVVSLQVTGTFFALIALIMAQAAWRSRPALHGSAAGMGSAVAGAADPRRFYIVAGVGLLFAYFAVSNFVRARRRDRQS